MYLAVVLYPGGCLTTVTVSHIEAVAFIQRMKERLKKASESNAKGYVFLLGEAVETL